MNLSRASRGAVLADALDTARDDISNAADSMQTAAMVGILAFSLISLVAIVALFRTLDAS